MNKEGRKKLDSFLRLFCVGIACTAILAVGTFALVGSGLFDGVVKSGSTNDNNNRNDIVDTGASDDNERANGFKFVKIGDEWYVEEIGDDVVVDGKVTLPTETGDGDNVVGVIDGAGKDNKNITEIVVPDGYKDITDGAFSGNDNVRRIVIDSKNIYDKVDDNLFGIGNENRKNVEVLVNSSIDDRSNKTLSDMDFYLVEKTEQNGKSYNRYFYNTTDYRIVNGVVYGFTTAGASKNLTTIDLNKEYTSGIVITEVADSAFEANQVAKTLNIGEGITRIGKFAFYNTKLQTVCTTNTESELLVDRCAFMNSKVTLLSLGRTVKINMYAFKNCRLSDKSSVLNAEYWSYFVAQQSFAGTIKIIQESRVPAGMLSTNKTGDQIFVSSIDEFMAMWVNVNENSIVRSSANAKITRSGNIVTIEGAYGAYGNFRISASNNFIGNNFASIINGHPEYELCYNDFNSFVEIKNGTVVGLKSGAEEKINFAVKTLPNYNRELVVDANIDTINLSLFKTLSNGENLVNGVTFKTVNDKKVVFEMISSDGESGVTIEFGNDTKLNAKKIYSMLDILEQFGNGVTAVKLVRVK